MEESAGDLIRLFNSTYNYDLKPLLEGKFVEFTGLNGSSKSLFIASLFLRLKREIIVITRSNRNAEELFSDLCIFLTAEDIFLFPSKETLPYDDTEPFGEITEKRISALNALLQKKGAVFILPVRSFIDYFIPRELFLHSSIQIKTGSTIPLVNLDDNLVRLGYEREDRVSYQGCFAIRGDILDVFPCGDKNPCRVEFFGDVVETIREFSPLTQRSIQERNEIRILPAREIVLDEEHMSMLEEKRNKENSEIIERAGEEGFFSGIENYISLFYNPPATLLDYTDESAVFLFDSIKDTRNQAEFFMRETEKLHDENRERRFILSPQKMIADFQDVFDKVKNHANLTILPESSGQKSIGIDFHIAEKKGYRGQIREFKRELEQLLRDEFAVIVGASYEGQTNRLREILKDLLAEFKHLYVKTLDLHEGFFSSKMKLFIILDREIFNRKRRYRKQFLEVRSSPLEGIFDIKKGDFIVHVEHGIGKYLGIERLVTRGIEKDFIKIAYRDDDEIFIPIDQINILQKYIGQEGRIPRIDRLGSPLWKRVKEHVRRSIKNLARQLLEIYSARAALEGYAFSKDMEWQYEFESGFRYEETPDQLRTIEEIKMDMEDPKPMDRLICGDVGYGKTEVAIRASFKAVMDGKQVAVLVPTTILAEQHLNTFADRFSLYPINVEMLSRFKTRSEQKAIIAKLINGEIDVVIGTHRLIQNDVHFKELGLVIIDEEQRFGVEHKEKLRQLRKLVDVITMTATPIPRTLYMAINRIRDMSVMETPPRERVPIETYVLEYNEEVIKSAIRREVERDGQIYYVHNRVMTIEEKAERLRMLMPDISFEVAHGQMDEHVLEDIMKAFYDMEFNVLVTTTIIESGLDIPNVNTIIIERADRFGLSQLYQLRGRVGRSRRKAYAYLFFPYSTQITEQAQKRLAVINDHTELGAGYSIAMKDLEIRGAGNILGREQHGDMLAVGYEMYVKLLDEAIKELQQGEAYRKEIEPVLDLKYRGYIPKRYIENENLRIEIYKRLAGVNAENELDTLKEEIIDRFGSPPPELVELFDIVKLRILCKEVGIRSLREKDNELELGFEQSRVDIISLIQKVNANRRVFSISPADHNTLHIYKTFEDNMQKLGFLKDLFDE
ncbi:MAG: transcription-repair coupling factor [Spirochaetota bacterium]|nr:MAG: transcription-repair coupling factor [Spirochaetota bacterium]